MRKFFSFLVLIVAITLFPGTSGLKAASAQQDKSHGIGPVKKVEIGPLNKKWVDEGKGLYNITLSLIHI